MEVEVRVVRAHVWLSSALFLRQDGFLSLTRVSGTEHVAHATLRSVQGRNGGQCSLEEAARQQGQRKCCRSIQVAWDEQSPISSSTCPRFSLPEVPIGGDSETRNKRKPNQQAPLPRLDFQLFLLRPRSRGGTSARARPQTVYIGMSGWQLSEKDVEALVSSKEVVFLTTLQDDLGTLEVKLRHVNSSDANKLEAPAAEDEGEVPTGFSINWSSSEALQKDLAEKARLKAEADKKLIAQLKQTAAKAAKRSESRDYLLMHLHQSRAAARIQRRFRELQRKKQEIIAKVRQEEEARIAAKKASVRKKVVSRNRQRALAMRARLMEHLDSNNSSFASKSAEPEDRVPAHEARRRIAEHVKTERAKLTERLAVLEIQRRQITASKRYSSTRSNQHSPQQRSGKLLDDELVRAVQGLHFNHHSNQLKPQHNQNLM